MKVHMKSKLQELRADYSRIRGGPFINFYCPILFRDEGVHLCEAHIINKAFRNSPRAWTIQRKDIDNFYGSHFEADFIDIEYIAENQTPDEVLTNKKLSKRFEPKILIDNRPVEYFFAQGDIPEHFTPIEFYDSDGEAVQLGLKVQPEDVSAALEKNWELEVSKDVRLAALVSLIKAAHLTLFELLGYRYAFSAGGYFVGRQILGEFFLNNRSNSKPVILENAYHFFHEYTHMVRPVQTNNLDLQGTISDRHFLICKGRNGSSYPWAFIVFIKTSRLLHSVMIPVFDQPDAVAKFTGFLQNDSDSIEASLCRFELDKSEFRELSTHRLVWPKNGVLYP